MPIPNGYVWHGPLCKARGGGAQHPKANGAMSRYPPASLLKAP